MAKNIDCFKGVTLKIGDKTLEEVFNDRAKGLSFSEQRKVGTDIALEYHKQLHTELNTFRKSINKDFKKEPYVSPDKSKEIQAVIDKYKQDEKSKKDETKEVRLPKTETKEVKSSSEEVLFRGSKNPIPENIQRN